MALLPATYPLDLKRFSFDSKKKTLTAFESDLRSTSFDGTYPWIVRLYDDAADWGCVILSHLTGKEERFYLSSVDESEGEIRSWTFRPLSPLANVEIVTIFND